MSTFVILFTSPILLPFFLISVELQYGRCIVQSLNTSLHYAHCAKPDIVVNVMAGKPGPKIDISLFRETSQEFGIKQRLSTNNH